MPLSIIVRGSESLLKEWISGIKEGDEEAVAAFIRFSLPYLRRITSRFSPSPEDEEEWIDLILVHTLDQIVNGKFSFISIDSFHAWFFRLATRRCIRLWHRKSRDHMSSVDHALLDASPHPSVGMPHEAMERAEVRKLVENAIEEVANSNIKNTLRMSLLKGWTIQEIAYKTGRPVNTIRTWDRRGKAVLREILERKHPELLERYGSSG